MPDFLVDAVATANVNLASPPSVVDTFSLVAGTSKVALTAQTNAAENGIYDYTTAPALVRNTVDGAATSMVYPRNFGVKSGSPDNKHSEWQFANDTTPTLGTDVVAISRYAWPRVLDASAGLRRIGPDLSVATTGILPGTYSRATFNERGQATVGQSAEEATTALEGLRLVYLSANSLRVEEGSLYVPNAGRVLDLATDTDLSGLTLTASTWYSLYGYESSGALAIDLPSTQGPVTTPYRGAARVKGPDGTPDDTRRFIRSIRTAGTANTIRPFYMGYDGWVWWQADTGQTPYRVLADGKQGATWSAPISCAAVVPPTARVVFLRIVNLSGAQSVEIGNDGSTAITALTASQGWVMPFVLTASQQFYFRYPAGLPGNGLNVDVIGYRESV